MDARTLWILGFTVVAWASAFPLIRIALAGYAPAQLAFFRFSVAAVLLLGIGAAMRMKLPPWRDLWRMAALGVLGIAGYAVMLGFGQKRVPAGSASLLISSAPVWMVVLAAALGRERATPRALAGIGTSLVGMLFIAAGKGIGLTSGPHALAVLGAALAGATYAILQKPFATKYGALRFTIVAVIGGALALSPSAAGLPAAIGAAPLSATLAVLYLALVPGALGYAGWAYASARASAAVTASALYLIPAVSMALSFFLLGEVPSSFALIGGTLVLAGVAVVHRRAAQPRPAAPAPALATRNA
jgi:drug/metabolite transporter (DMT)-like permease